MGHSCTDRHTIDDHGQPVTVTCTVRAGHDGRHQCYWRDRLHEWS